MELTLRPTFQDVSAGGVELRVQTTEIVVDRCGAEHTDALALTLLYLKPLCLDNDAQTLDEEDTAEDWQHQLLMDDQGTDTNDSANG